MAPTWCPCRRLHHRVHLSSHRDRGRPAGELDVAHRRYYCANTYTTTASCHCCYEGVLRQVGGEMVSPSHVVKLQKRKKRAVTNFELLKMQQRARAGAAVCNGLVGLPAGALCPWVQPMAGLASSPTSLSRRAAIFASAQKFDDFSPASSTTDKPTNHQHNGPLIVRQTHRACILFPTQRILTTFSASPPRTTSPSPRRF